jgi:hypothetical protein
MPNGGADCCFQCGFNRVNRLLLEGRPKTLGQSGRDYCVIRNQPISQPTETFCLNYHRYWAGEAASEVPDGPIFASGHYERGYSRIPWNGSHEPQLQDGDSTIRGWCVVCGQRFERGIQVGTASGESKDFCGNVHYVQWWKETHPGQTLVWNESGD